MQVAILTFEGYNELDSLIAFGILNRFKQPGWRVSIASPTPRVRSMNGVVIESQISLRDASSADAVIVGSGILTREVVKDIPLMAELRLDPSTSLEEAFVHFNAPNDTGGTVSAEAASIVPSASPNRRSQGDLL